MVNMGDIWGPPGSSHQDRVRHARHLLGGTFIGDMQRGGARGGRGSLLMVMEAGQPGRGEGGRIWESQLQPERQC